MEHLVRFTTAEGREGHHTAPGLEEALKFVEHLRNSEDATDVSVYRMQQVPIEFKAYYKVEITAAGEGDGVVLPPAPPPVETVAQDTADDEERSVARPHLVTTGGGDGESDGSGRRLFTRS